MQRDVKLFTIRNCILTTIFALFLFFTNGVKQVQAQQVLTQNYGSIVTDYKFSETAYQKMLKGFFDGM